MGRYQVRKCRASAHETVLGDHDVCRILARIASSLCATWLCVGGEGEPGRGIFTLLHKAAGHPLVNISGLAIVSFTELSKHGRLDTQFLLPVLQRRAIVPHQTLDGTSILTADDISDVGFHEFQIFRDNVLADALDACFRASDHQYMDSCISAVEEFCVESPMADVSFQLEAALYCIAAICHSLHDRKFQAHMDRLSAALQMKSLSLLSNPITVTRMCQTLRKVRRPQRFFMFHTCY